MKVYNFEEMSKKFGIGYTYHTDINDPNSVFITQVFNGISTDIYKIYASCDDAFDAYIKQKKITRENDIKNLEISLSQVSIFGKIFNRTNIKNAKEKLEKWKTTSISGSDLKVEHVSINKDSLYQEIMPELVIGDKVYVSVISKNVVDIGVYEQEIKKVSYYINDKPTIKFIDDKEINQHDLYITYQAATLDGDLINNLTKKIDLEKDTEFHNGYTYHYTFCHKEKAVAFFNERMLDKIEYYKSKIIK